MDNATVVLITAIVTRALVQEVEEIKERGYRVLVLYAGDGAPEMDLPGVPVFRVGRALHLSETGGETGGDTGGDTGAEVNGRDIGSARENNMGEYTRGGA